MEKYTLIVAEKPDAAQRIAAALDADGKARRTNEGGIPCYVARRDKKIVVVSALGHLYTVAGENCRRQEYPVFDFKWVPRYEAEKGARHTRVWLQAIMRLAKHADVFIDACDYDVEGSIIGYCILKYACDCKEQTAKRMKYSTLTQTELQKAYTEPLPHLDFALIEAGLTRHEVDWLYGINLSRALTTAASKRSGKYTTLSAGRVQAPVLRFLAAREKAIKTFVPTPYYVVKAQIELGNRVFEAEYEKKPIETKKEAIAVLDACEDKSGQVGKIDIAEFEEPPPLPFDLGGLQGEAYRLFRYAPKRTLSLAQRLYVDALISYPRTSSQKLPLAIDYRAILRGLNKAPEYRNPTAELLARPKLRPREGRREDPAHPAIYPTGNLPEQNLGDSERSIWNLIVRRFMAVFGEPAIEQSVKICISVGGHRFYVTGRRTLSEGWLRFYRIGSGPEETALPLAKEGQMVNLKKVILKNKFTEPPPRYNPASLLKKMEETGIGTKSTRADIIQTLNDRKYIQSEKIQVTELGFMVLDILESYCPTVISIKLTRELEEKMDRIQEGIERREDVLANVVEILKPIMMELKEKEETIGQQLGNVIKRATLDERTVGGCPVCGTGKLVILRSKKTRKRFVGCTNYFKGTCKTSFPLPQKGTVRPLNKKCQRCSWPIVQARLGGRRPWNLCLNPKCPSNEKRKRRIEMPDMRWKRS